MNPILIETLAKTLQAKTLQDELRREYESIDKINQATGEIEPVKHSRISLVVAGALIFVVVLATLTFLVV